MFRKMSRERYLSDAELSRFMAVVRQRNNPRHHALFAVLANTGIRPGEAHLLTRNDVHPHASPPWIRVRRLKKRRDATMIDDIEISAELATVLSAYLPLAEDNVDGRLFTANRRTTQRLFKEYARRAGLWTGHHLYVLRHTAATRMYVATRDITLVQAMLGHESPDTSCIYAHIPKTLLLDAANTMPIHV
jgi:integrase